MLKNFVYLNLCIIDGYFLVPILSLQMGSSLTGLGTRLHDVWNLIVHLSYAVWIRMIWYMWPYYTYFLMKCLIESDISYNQTFLKKLSVIRRHIPKAEILKLVWRWMANCNINMCMETDLNYDVYIKSILVHGHCAFFTVWCTCVRSIRCSIKKRWMNNICNRYCLFSICVLERTLSMRRLFWAPKTNYTKNIHIFTHNNLVLFWPSYEIYR